MIAIISDTKTAQQHYYKAKAELEGAEEVWKNSWWTDKESANYDVVQKKQMEYVLWKRILDTNAHEVTEHPMNRKEDLK